ncbi:unnamed protein product, partial [Onchocerca flexuosa]|uniref:FH2 domain-containing protein n=1 Tax=Onchocerca flexuosa TaxID=387005 RepID=A0A183HNS9_9BILA
FDKFIHDYRETAEPSTYSSYESDTPIDATLKKDFINVERKLKKTSYAIKKLPKTEALDGLCLRVESMLEIFKTLKIIKEDNKEEFNLHNVPLPDYDPADIELLLGKDFASTQVIQKNALSKFEDRLREQITGNIQMSKILLKECDETIPSYREKGDFMRFLFKVCGYNGCYGFFGGSQR